jgi:phosphoribosylglycinamide formyltransferase 2
MTLLGTALRPAATRVMLLGSGELGKEVAIECQRLGVEVIAVDRYRRASHALPIAHTLSTCWMAKPRQLVERKTALYRAGN